jgi:P27 family predicted phage terminase small subunit
MPKAPVIAAFSAKAIPEPPEELAEAGRHLWRTVMHRYVIEDAHAEVLKLACLSADSAASMRRQIKAEGETVTGSTGQPAAHPLIAAEGAAQKRVAQFLTRLGLFDEPKRSKAGRPPGQLIMPRPPVRDGEITDEIMVLFDHNIELLKQGADKADAPSALHDELHDVEYRLGVLMRKTFGEHWAFGCGSPADPALDDECPYGPGYQMAVDWPHKQRDRQQLLAALAARRRQR